MDKITLEKLKTLTILYAEDEDKIRKKISDSLNYYVKNVIEASDGQEALELYHEYNPDIVFTDILMPNIDGIELVKEIRKNSTKTPVVIITAHTDKEYLLGAIDLHLEQYIVKPINLASLKKALIKCLKVVSDNNSIIEELKDSYRYDIDKKTILYNDTKTDLSPKEIKLLELLLQNKNRVVCYQEIEQHVWEDEYMSENALKSLLKNLRHKLPENYIRNLSGIGYRLQSD